MAGLPHCKEARSKPIKTFWQKGCTYKNFGRTDLPGRGCMRWRHTALSREMQSLNPLFETEHEILKPGRKHRNHTPLLAKSTIHLLYCNCEGDFKDFSRIKKTNCFLHHSFQGPLDTSKINGIVRLQGIKKTQTDLYHFSPFTLS